MRYLTTARSIARYLGVSVGRVWHVLRSRRVEPIARADRTWVFGDDVVDFVDYELCQIDARRQQPLQHR